MKTVAAVSPLLGVLVCLAPGPASAQVPNDLIGRWSSSPDMCEDNADAGITVFGITPSGIVWYEIDCDIDEARPKRDGASFSVSCFKGGGATGNGGIEVVRQGGDRIDVSVSRMAFAVAQRYGLHRCAGDPAAMSAVKSSRWSHNGSTVMLYAEGDRRAFYYERPRPGMIEAGARRGRLLFKGEIVGERYVGLAYVFSRKCGPRSYPVDGPVLDEHARVVLHGKAPRVDENCKVAGHSDDELELVLIGK